MTTTVIVEAHCDDKTEVSIVRGSENTGESYVLQDGETKELYVYDDFQITVREVPKQ